MADIPKIRFKGFTEPWEQRKLGEVLKERTERAKGDEELLSVTIANGVIRQIDSEKRNTASEDRSNYKIVKKGDVPYNSMRMWQGAVGNSKYNGIVSPAYTILTPTPEANGKFFMELFKKKSTLQIFQRWSQGLTSDTWNLKYPILSSIQFAIPSVEEQEKIAEYFSSLDHLITLHQRKCDDTKELKKYMLQKMFPKNGEKFPEIRFKGFTEAWEQRKLGDLLNETREKTSVEDEDTLLSCAIDGMFLNSELFSHFRGSSNIGYLKVKKNDLILSAQNLHLGNCNVNLRFEHGIISPAYKVYELINCDPLFMQAWVKQDKTKDFFLKASTEGASICRKNIVWEELYKQELPVPKINEQVKIGAFFQNLDNLITLHQRKCDTLKELKKYMLQNMFPKKG